MNIVQGSKFKDQSTILNSLITFFIFLHFIKKTDNMEPKKVLLAEDDMNLGKVLTTVLTGKGFDVKHANNGEAAYELFCLNEFDICLIDVMMPLKDGFTLAQEIRKMDKRIPIIFLTAKTMQEDMIKGLSIGGDDYITKPFTMEILLARMQALLRRTGAQEEPESHIVSIGNLQFDRKRQVLISNPFAQIAEKRAQRADYQCAQHGFQAGLVGLLLGGLDDYIGGLQ